MISSLSIVAMLISVLISFGIPIGLIVYMVKKEKASLKAVLVGALVFFVFQMLTRIPLLQVISKQAWYFNMSSNVVLLGLFLGLTAGIFEEIGRFLGFKFLLKNKLSWSNGVAFGIGHGGIEAIILVGISNVNNIIYSIMINSGTFDTAIASKLPAETAYLIKSQLISLAPGMFLAGGVERIFAMTIQIAFSLLVLYGVMSKRFLYVVYAILLHGLVDAPLVFLMSKGISIWAIEGLIALCTAVGLYYISKSREIFRRSFEDLGDVKNIN